MNLLKNMTRVQRLLFTFLVCLSAVLGYLLYNTTAENIQGQKQLKEVKEENLDLSQDIEIFKQKYDNLERKLTELDKRVVKISYKKPYKKKKISAAGKNSKKKSYYKKSKVNYKKLYFQLKKQCDTGKKVKYKSPRTYRR